MQVIARIRRRLADESGFTMVTVMGVLLVATLFSVAAISAAQKDIAPSREDVDRKAAYAAAEAGVNDYMARLNQDTNYWTNCTNVPPRRRSTSRSRVTGAAGPHVAQRAGLDRGRLHDRAHPGQRGDLQPARPRRQHDRHERRVHDPRDRPLARRGHRQRRSTGRSPRSFRRRGFLDFLYFTDLETRDPEFFSTTPTSYGDGARSVHRSTSATAARAAIPARTSPSPTTTWSTARCTRTTACWSRATPTSAATRTTTSR